MNEIFWYLIKLDFSMFLLFHIVFLNLHFLESMFQHSILLSFPQINVQSYWQGKGKKEKNLSRTCHPSTTFFLTFLPFPSFQFRIKRGRYNLLKFLSKLIKAQHGNGLKFGCFFTLKENDSYFLHFYSIQKMTHFFQGS